MEAIASARIMIKHSRVKDHQARSRDLPGATHGTRTRHRIGPYRWAVVALLVAAVSWPVSAAQITLTPGAGRGVEWATAELRQVLPSDVTVRCDLQPDSRIPTQGYAIHGTRSLVTVSASGAVGLLYGLLELRDRIVDGMDAAAPFDLRSSPKMPWRAITMDLPMYLGIPLYNDQWRGYEPNDHNASGPFHDREMWTREFRRMASERLNAIVFLHPHPFPAFIDYSARYPEAAWLTPDELAAKREALRWLIAEAREYGVTIHFLTWNIWLPRGFAQHHGIAQDGVDSPLTREFTRWSVAEMYRTYPGLGGLITEAAEQPPGCVDFVREAIVAGLREITPRPTFFFWSWCSYPKQAREVLDAYDGPSYCLNYLQYEQFFASRADPRIGLFSRDIGGKQMAALGGPKCAHAYFLWGDPETAHQVMRNLYANNNGRAFALEATRYPDRWLAEQAFTRYAWDPMQPYDAAFWRRALARRYGSPEIAEPLLEAMTAASRIIPRQMHLTHSQTDRFMPQMGLTLAQVLEMPSISTYIFENSQTVGPDGYLTPNMGLSRPNPDWGERVEPIRQFALAQLSDPARRARLLASWQTERAALGYAPRPVQPNDTTPLEIARDLDALRGQVERALPRITGATANADELALIVDYLRMNVALARHFAAKDRAALAWERCRLDGDPAQTREAAWQLAVSAAAWRKLADVGDRVHPAGVWYNANAVPYPPPWSQMDLWYGYGGRHGSFADRTRLWERELDLVRRELATAPHARIAPPLPEDLREPKPDGQSVARIDFEAGDDRYQVIAAEGTIATLTEDPSLAVEGKRSLLADSRGSDEEWNLFFETDPKRLSLTPGAEYQVIVRYRVVNGGEARYRAPFGTALRSETGGVPSDVGDARFWSGPEGAVRERVMFARLGDYPDYHLFFCIHGKAAIVIDDIRIERLR